MSATNGTLAHATLTPAMRRCLGAYRLLAERLNRAPTANELSHLQDGIANESVRRLIEKLAVRGYQLPLSRRHCTPRGNGVIAVAVHDRQPSAAERELGHVRGLLREADIILSHITVADRPARDEWRRRAAEYLGSKEA